MTDLAMVDWVQVKDAEMVSVARAEFALRGIFNVETLELRSISLRLVPFQLYVSPLLDALKLVTDSFARIEHGLLNHLQRSDSSFGLYHSRSIIPRWNKLWIRRKMSEWRMSKR